MKKLLLACACVLSLASCGSITTPLTATSNPVETKLANQATPPIVGVCSVRKMLTLVSTKLPRMQVSQRFLTLIVTVRNLVSLEHVKKSLPEFTVSKKNSYLISTDT